MITLNTPFGLGRRAYTYFLLKRLSIPLILLFVALVGVIFSDVLIQGVVSLGSIGGPVTHAAQSNALALVSNTIFILIFAAVLVGVVGFIIANLEYKNHLITIEEFNLSIKKGILTTTETSIPYHEIQDILMDRDLNHKALGLARLVFDIDFHSGGSHSTPTQIVIEYIDLDLATSIKEYLEGKIGIQVIENKKAVDNEKPQQPVQPIPPANLPV